LGINRREGFVDVVIKNKTGDSEKLLIIILPVAEPVNENL
jgi:hypothetical protein